MRYDGTVRHGGWVRRRRSRHHPSRRPHARRADHRVERRRTIASWSDLPWVGHRSRSLGTRTLPLDRRQRHTGRGGPRRRLGRPQRSTESLVGARPRHGARPLTPARVRGSCAGSRSRTRPSRRRRRRDPSRSPSPSWPGSRRWWPSRRGGPRPRPGGRRRTPSSPTVRLMRVQRGGAALVRHRTEQIVGSIDRAATAAAQRRERALCAASVERLQTHVVEPQPLAVGREPLVEPDVVPTCRRHRVAEPLVGQFVRQEQVLHVAERAVEITDAEQGEALGLHREAGHRVGDRDAVPVERVRAEQIGEVRELLVDYRRVRVEELWRATPAPHFASAPRTSTSRGRR